MSNDPHANAPMNVVGTLPDTAKAVMILIHGRGASAESILDLRNEFDCRWFLVYRTASDARYMVSATVYRAETGQ